MPAEIMAEASARSDDETMVDFDLDLDLMAAVNLFLDSLGVNATIAIVVVAATFLIVYVLPIC